MKNRFITFITTVPRLSALLLGASIAVASTEGSSPTMEQVYQNRKMPAWFNEAKFGIFVTWGPYSVPAYRKGGYAEWYWKDMERNPDTKAFHERVYGADFSYVKFAEMLKAELWDPDAWCDLFFESGAKYAILTANYHDGFAMWPTKYAKTHESEQWNSMVTGPKRDILGELTKAGEKRGLKMGLYYSLYEWYHPLWLTNQEQFAQEWLAPKFKEVVSTYRPWFIFLDGDWPMSWEKWRSNELADWLYTQSPVKDTVVINDRWGGSRGKYGDVIESEYGGGKYTTPERPWQEDRGIGGSYGYNRAEGIKNYDSRDKLLRTFSGVVGGGGNFLLGIGASADGRIPVIMQERLLQIGSWLKINGAAIYGTTANPFWPRQFGWGTVSKKPGELFLHIHDPKREELEIKGIDAKVKSAVLFTENGKVPVAFRSENGSLKLNWSRHLNDPGVTVIAVNLEEGYTVDRTPRQFENGVVDFHCRAMTIHGTKAYVKYGGAGTDLLVENWSDPGEYISAEFIIEKPGTYAVTLLCASAKEEKVTQTGADAAIAPLSGEKTGGRFTLQIGDTSKEMDVPQMPPNRKIGEAQAGTVELAAGKQSFSIKPVNNGNWQGFLFQGISLTPVK